MEDEIKEIRSLINTINENKLPTNHPDEFYNFAGISKDKTGLNVNIYLDQCQSYIQNNHPLWVYITNGYTESADFIPISVDNLHVYCDKDNLQIYQKDLNDVLCFVVEHKQEICDIANEVIEITDFSNALQWIK